MIRGRSTARGPPESALKVTIKSGIVVHATSRTGVYMKTIALVCGWTAVMTALGSSPAASGSLDTPSALEANKRLVMRYYEAARSGQYDEIDRIFAPHYIRHNQSELASRLPRKASWRAGSTGTCRSCRGSTMSSSQKAIWSPSIGGCRSSW
jgi:hypothetical protein